MADQVFKMKDREGYLLRFTLTKNVRKGPPRSFALVPFDESDMCPVSWINYYLSVCDLLDWLKVISLERLIAIGM